MDTYTETAHGSMLTMVNTPISQQSSNLALVTLTIPEIASILRLSVKRTYALAKRGLLPTIIVGGAWRCSVTMLERYLKASGSRRSHHHSPSLTMRSSASGLSLCGNERSKKILRNSIASIGEASSQKNDLGRSLEMTRHGQR